MCITAGLFMKILFLGEIGIGQTSLMRMRAFQRLGYEVRGVHTVDPWRKASWLGRQVQRRTGSGPVIGEINRSVLAAARQFRPNLVWAEKQEFLWAETIETLKRLGAKTAHFTPDPYFSLAWKRTRIMDQAMGEFDTLLYCKRYERADYEALGKPLQYMPLGYCDEVHRPMQPLEPRWHSQIGFLGGWEPRRERLLDALSTNGVVLKVWGGYWDFLADGRWTVKREIILRQLAGVEPFAIHRNQRLANALQGDEVYGDDYARALSGAKIGLGLLRKVWPDQHTTRTFEIPACGSMLLADRSDEHREFFEEGVEADFFSSIEELVDKAKFYTSNETVRTRIAAAGLERCQRGAYAYIHRLKEVLSAMERVDASAEMQPMKST